jgi:phenylalanyl-tRNA synthetase beta chain
LRDRLALFEIGPVFLPVDGQPLPEEASHLAIAMTGQRRPPAWDDRASAQMDFYDLKGVIESLLESIHIGAVSFSPAEHSAFHPGKSAQVSANGVVLGTFGELHPQVKSQYDFLSPAVLAADFDLTALIQASASRYEITPVPVFPPVLEDLALIVEENVSAADVEAAIRQGGGKLLTEVRLFDIFRGEQIGAGKKSLAYALSYQAADHTLNPGEANQIRQRILRRVEQLVGAQLRS